MPIILITLSLLLLRYFEVWKFATMSWWWPVGFMIFAFVWFEFVEPILGLDKRKAHNVDEARRKERIAQSFEKKKRK
ncbi:MAG: TIGR04438 family Trp-rich protein [Pseudomonadota bacterium]